MSPPRPKKKRTPRDLARSRERAERRAIAAAGQVALDPWPAFTALDPAPRFTLPKARSR